MDITLIDLWLPILVAGVVCFLASSAMWMVLPHHKADIQPLPDEAAFNAAVGPLSLKPGYYMYPNCHGKEDMKSDAFKARWRPAPGARSTCWATSPTSPKTCS